MTPKQSTQSRATRRYNSPRRVEQAVATRSAVITAARDLILTRGYAATTVADIARQARVAVDTVYATVGRKPDLLRAVLESALSGVHEAIPGPDRDYADKVRAESTARGKLAAYVDGLVPLQERLAPVYLALRDASTSEADAADLWEQISQRRADNMRELAADLRATGEVRDDLTDEEVADIIWSMNGPEYWQLLVAQRGWAPERFATHLTDTWAGILLREPRALKRSRALVAPDPHGG